jgi:1-phosphatidylinositol-3-phosphate 5-kinase
MTGEALLHLPLGKIKFCTILRCLLICCSSADYKCELAGISLSTTGSSDHSNPSAPSPSITTTTTNQSSFLGSHTGHKLFSSSLAKPDPDQEGIIWHEPEVFSAVVSRKEHPRDHASLHSLRELLRNKTPVEGSNGLSSRIGGTDTSKSRNVSGPPSAWVGPAVGGEVSGLPGADSASKFVQDIEAASIESSQVSSVSGSEESKSQIVEAHIRRGQASSLLSEDSGSTVGPKNGGIAEPPAPPPKDVEYSSPPSEPSSPPAETSSFFANSLTNAVRYILRTGETTQPVSPSFTTQHSPQLADSFRIDDRPHIKYDWMIGKRLKFSCTVYYAKQFDSLRRQCGIEDVFLRSLGRSANWAAEGGKSKSNFWKTSDDRFIIKTLVNAWNVADL